MPLRSVKMKRFIFGFQRRVWCPKWTPLSRSWRIVTTAMAAAPLHGPGGRVGARSRPARLRRAGACARALPDARVALARERDRVGAPAMVARGGRANFGRPEFGRAQSTRPLARRQPRR